MKVRRILCAVFCVACSAIVFFYIRAQPGMLEIYFLDIGQGDAIYIRTPTGKDMLIDGGPSRTVLQKLSKVMPWHDRSIDVLLATHPDADHIGGLPDILERYDIGTFLESGIESKNAIDDELRRLRDEKKISRVLARRGMIIHFGDGVRFDILFPFGDVSGMKETNDASIIGQLRYGSTTVMLTGDASSKIENMLVAKDGKRLRSDVLKAGHHGSRTSSSENFLRFVSPSLAIISAGQKNRYGHPHMEVLDRLEKLGIRIRRTDGEGTIGLVSDGKGFKNK